jgi:hypothetical protein
VFLDVAVFLLSSDVLEVANVVVVFLEVPVDLLSPVLFDVLYVVVVL